jgi:hypothetical protein
VPETDDDGLPRVEDLDASHSNAPQAKAEEKGDDKFDFLCPNGHKLHGRSSLQGRPGQCPHCNARFLIPAPCDDEDGGASAEDPRDFPAIDVHGEDGDEGSFATAEAVVFSIHDEPPPAPVSVSCHPLAQIIRKLWAETRGAGVLELLLDDGVSLLAESFSAELSQHEFGVFAVRGETKTQSVTIVPWDSINRATLLNLADLPSDLFRATFPSRRRPDRAR